MTRHWRDFSKDELLKLKVGRFNAQKTYDRVLLANTRKKHSSGYNLFAIIGCNDSPIEICGYADSFYSANNVRIAIDCSMHGVFSIFAKNGRIKLGEVLSDTAFYEVA